MTSELLILWHSTLNIWAELNPTPPHNKYCNAFLIYIISFQTLIQFRPGWHNFFPGLRAQFFQKICLIMRNSKVFDKKCCIFISAAKNTIIWGNSYFVRPDLIMWGQKSLSEAWLHSVRLCQSVMMASSPFLCSQPHSNKFPKFRTRKSGSASERCSHARALYVSLF